MYCTEPVYYNSLLEGIEASDTRCLYNIAVTVESAAAWPESITHCRKDIYRIYTKFKVSLPASEIRDDKDGEVGKQRSPDVVGMVYKDLLDLQRVAQIHRRGDFRGMKFRVRDSDDGEDNHYALCCSQSSTLTGGNRGR